MSFYQYLEVRVGRNWSSERDLIGFYNSLSDSYSAASTGLYQYLKGVELDNGADNAPHTVLLDEANLSPIEHYGATILSIADAESEKSIQLAHEKLPLPNDIRFVATINFDMTTEPLSPRLIDRAPVIPFDVFIDQEADYSDDTIEFSVSADVFQSIFGKNSVFQNVENSTLPDSLNDVINAMKESSPEYGAPLIVSRRKQAAMLSYYNVLTEVLVASAALPSTLASERAGDYTALYFLLPTINLHGEAGKNRLDLIAQKLNSNGFAYSIKKLEDIKQRGELNLDTYNFLHY